MADLALQLGYARTNDMEGRNLSRVCPTVVNKPGKACINSYFCETSKSVSLSEFAENKIVGFSVGMAGKTGCFLLHC